MQVVRYASSSDAGEMLALWRTAFPEDTDEDIAAFLERFLNTAVVIAEDSHVVSMLFLLPASLYCSERDMPVSYIYAGATAPTHRSQGLYRRLIEFAAVEAAQRGCAALFLRPADEALAESYRRMGFVVPLYTARAADICGTTVDAAAYMREKHACLARLLVPHIVWSPAVDEYLQSFTTAYRDANGDLMLASQDGVCLEYVRASHADARLMAGLLRPLNNETFAQLAPIYMGYGLE